MICQTQNQTTSRANLPIVSRPPLRYFGGKFRSAAEIIARMPSHRYYTEAFGGGAFPLLLKPRSHGEAYNDLDGEVVNVFRVLQDRDSARELERLLRLTPFARSEFDLSYVPADTPIERARRMLIRSFMGFGSDSVTRMHRTGFRAHSKRSGTSPAMDWARYPDHIATFTARLQGVTIENRHALEVLRAHDDPRTLHYVDPPYLMSVRGVTAQRRSAYRHEMTDDDHQDLAQALHELKGMVIVSGYASDLYDALYPAAGGWRTETFSAYAGRAGGANVRQEVLWFNPAAWEALRRARAGHQPELQLEEEGDADVR